MIDLIIDLDMSHGKKYGFVSFPLFRFTLVINGEISILKVIKNEFIEVIPFKFVNLWG